jgi:hypothetical protein
MMRILLPLLALGLAAPAAAQPAPRLVSEYVVEPDGAGGIARDVVTTRAFHRVTDFDPEPAERLIEVESVRESFAEDGATEESTVARAFAWTGEGFTRPLWEYRADGARPSIVHGTYLRVTRSGCCATDDTHTLVSLRTGAPLLTYTEEPLFVGTPDGSGEIVVALELPSGLTVPDTLVMERGFRGILRMAGPEGRMDALAVHTGDDDGWLRPQVMRCGPAGGVLVGEWEARDGEFFVCLQLRPDGWIVVPVRGGRFDPADAVLPQGVAVTRWTGAWTGGG